MKFTLHTSFYNGERFIHQLYDKLKLQTYKNWEWIVTDDFSNDNGKQILKEIAANDRKVTYVEQSEKKQMFWNPQIFCRDAQIIVQLDQDDYPLPNALAVYHHFFTKFPHVDVITCAANQYNDDGSWNLYSNRNFLKYPNLAKSGKLTYLRAWRNNPNLNIDFNPNGWMKYFYNDLAILSVIEEHGKVLNLPRNLYLYNRRTDSVSNEKHIDVKPVREENDKLVKIINDRRYDENMDTLERYFDPIYEDTQAFMDHDMCNTSEPLKISYHTKNITPHNQQLLKELFFDWDIKVNTHDGDEDYLILKATDTSDIDYLLSLNNIKNIKNKFVLIPDLRNKTKHTSKNIREKLTQNFPVYFRADDNMLIKIFK